MTQARAAMTRKHQAPPPIHVSKVLVTRALAIEVATNATTDRAFLEVGIIQARENNHISMDDWQILLRTRTYLAKYVSSPAFTIFLTTGIRGANEPKPILRNHRDQEKIETKVSKLFGEISSKSVVQLSYLDSWWSPRSADFLSRSADYLRRYNCLRSFHSVFHLVTASGTSCSHSSASQFLLSARSSQCPAWLPFKNRKGRFLT